MVGLAACYPVGHLDLLFATVQAAWLWAVVVGLSMGAFPLILTLTGLRSRIDVGTVALSGFTQSVGYAVAAVGPFGMGLLYDLTGGWAVPLLLLTALAVPQLIAGLMIARSSYIEDALATPSRRSRSARRSSRRPES